MLPTALPDARKVTGGTTRRGDAEPPLTTTIPVEIIMATLLNTPKSGVDNLGARSPALDAWDAAWAAYEPVELNWHKEYDQADEMPASPEKDEAYRRFYRVHLPEYQKLRDEFMRVPAPTIEALAKKMEVADATDDEHHGFCLADVRRLAHDARLSK
jgi:hypothetical protein